MATHHSNWLASDIPAISEESRPPDAEGTADAFAQSGYRFEHAIADLVDNCVDAHARTVLICFVTHDSTLEQIVVADNGAGMSEDRLSEAMRYGARVDRERTSLGKFGVGMKSASRSQCRDLSVITMRRRRVVGRRWTAESIKRGWECEISRPEGGSPIHVPRLGADGVTPCQVPILGRGSCLRRTTPSSVDSEG